MRSFCWIALVAFSLPGALQAQPNVLITKETQKAIDVGLKYLAKEQAEDGSWGNGQYKGSVALTSLGGLAFLSGNHHPDRGAYGKVVTKAVRRVLSQEDANLPGFFKEGTHGPMYGHAFAVLFLSDAHGTIADEKLKADVKGALERAVKLILASQNRDGGWRYRPQPLDADLTVTACQAVALRAARDEGIGVPKAALDRAIRYVSSCKHPDNDGFRYQTFGGPAGFARTAAALTALNRLGAKDGEIIDKGLNFLVNVGNAKDVALHYYFGQFYASRAMWYSGDKNWQKWYPQCRDDLLKLRTEAGTWEQGGTMDAHFCTAVALIVLQTPLGHLASLQR